MGALITERRVREKERERVKATHKGLHKKNYSSKLLIGKRRGDAYTSSGAQSLKL